MNETEIRIREIDALNKAPGFETTLEFLTMLREEPPDPMRKYAKGFIKHKP